MTYDAQSLMAYLSQAEALQYFGAVCDFADASPPALVQHWIAARERLGEPILRAGKPFLEPLGAEHQNYLDRVTTTAHFKAAVGDLPWSFELVEIDPLLCFQLHIIPALAGSNWSRARALPPSGTIIRRCLPTRAAPLPEVQLQQMQGLQGQPLLRLLSTDVSLTVLQAHVRQVKGRRVLSLALDIGVRCPLVQVVALGGRYYLKNGFHRAFRLRQLGATHIPAVVIEPRSYEQAGLVPGFAQHVLDSPNPPTCGHFSQGRAYPVPLREAGGVIEIGWIQGAYQRGA